MRRRLLVAACLTVTLAGAVAAAGFLTRGGPQIAPAPARWSSAALPVGQAASVAGPAEPPRDCFQTTTGVAARGDDIWTSDDCLAGAGDDDAAAATPRYAIDRLRPDGTVQRLEPVEIDGAAVGYVKVEAVGPDGTLFATGEDGELITRSPDGRWRRPPEGGTPVDVHVDEVGAAYLADRNAVRVLSAGGVGRILVGDPDAPYNGVTGYADQAVPNPRPAASSEIPTLTGITVRRDGTVVLLATDTILTVDPQGMLRTLVTPDSSGSDPRTRLVRADPLRSSPGSSLVSAVPYGDDVLVYDLSAGRLLRVDAAGGITSVAGDAADEDGAPASGYRPRAAIAEQVANRGRQVPLAEASLSSVTGGLAVLDGQLLMGAGERGVLRLGLPGP